MDSGSDSESEGDICKTISKFMKDHHYSAEPVVDIVEPDPVRQVESSACNEDFDDELNDLLEEQILLKKIKHVNDYRKSLACYRDPELDRVDHIIKPKIENNEIKKETKTSLSPFDNDACKDDKILECILPTDNTGSRQFFETRNPLETLKKLSKASAINVLMQSELTTLESVLMERLKEVIKEQIEVRAEISRLKVLQKHNEKKTLRKVVWYTLFGRPYFKDEQKYSCPKNEDAKTMKLRNQILTVNLFQSKAWRIKDKYYLEEGVRKILVEEQASKFYEKENELKNQLKKNAISDTKMKNNIKSELQCIRRKIETLETISLKELFSLCEPDREFDWLKIAAKDVPKHSSEECQRMWHLYVKPTVNKNRFTYNEDCELKKLIEKFGEQSWDVIAKKLRTSRTEFLCFLNYKRRLKKGRNNCGKWTKHEDRKLLGIIKRLRIGDFIPWQKVAFYFEDRTLSQLYNRWVHSINPDLKKGRFNKMEDRIILSYVRKYGENFTKISKLLGYRTSTQVRQRYSLTKNVNLNVVGRWSLEEDETLLALVEKYGVSRWSDISRQFMTRTRTQIRHRYKAIKNFLRKYPDLGIADIHRGPTARSQYLMPVSAAEVKAAITEQEDKMLSELVKESKIKKGSTQTHDVAITKLKCGRKKSHGRSKLDLKLIEYFKEVFKTDKLKLRTHYIKPDVNKAASALMLFCCYFKTSLILSGDEFNKAVKKLPRTIKSIVFRMIEDERGCENVKAKFVDFTTNSVVPDSYDLTTVNHNSLFIDCLPVNPKETLVSEFYYLLSDYTEETKLDEITVNSERSKTLNVIPYFLPPNIITMIGCRSLILIKGKILNSLTYKCTGPNYYFANDVSLMKQKNLKYFNGYFSEDELESDCDGSNDIKNENFGEMDSSKLPDDDLYLNKNVSTGSSSLSCLQSGSSIDVKPLHTCCETLHPLPSSSEECGTSSPPILFSDTPFLYEVENFKPPDEQRKENTMDVRIERLTKQEAIDLWKERIMALFGWPLALANHVPDFSVNEDEINTNEIKQNKKPQHKNNMNGMSSNVLRVKGSVKNKNKIQSSKLEDSSKEKISNNVAHELNSACSITEVEPKETSNPNSYNKIKRVRRKTNSTSGSIIGGSDANSGEIVVDKSVAYVPPCDEPLILRSKRLRKSNKLFDEYKMYK